jgi:hypothetical protein
MAGPFNRIENQNVMVTLSMMNSACQYKYVTATRPGLKRFAAFFIAVRGILGYFRLRETVRHRAGQTRRHPLRPTAIANRCRKKMPDESVDPHFHDPAGDGLLIEPVPA